MKKYKSTIAALLMLPLMCSCSALSGLSSGQSSNSKATSTTQKKTSKDNKPTGPSAREKVDEVPVETYTPTDIEQGCVRGSWAIVEVDGKKPVAEEPAYIIFEQNDPATGGKANRMYGCNGCNTINATYTFNSADHTLSFSNAATTMRMCAPGVTDAEINKALNDTRYYAWEKRGSQFYLFLKNSAHDTVMTLMHQCFDFLHGTWRVEEINGEEVDNPDVKLVFDVASGKLHGNTGCNILNAALDVNPASVNTVSIQNILTTRMACRDQQLESDLIVALEEAYSAKPIDEKEAELLNSSGKTIIKLLRLPEDK